MRYAIWYEFIGYSFVDYAISNMAVNTPFPRKLSLITLIA